MSALGLADLRVEAEITGFGARITGLDLRQPLGADVRNAVMAAFARYGVVWFPNQSLDLDQLEAFTLQFGAFGHDPFVKPMAERPHVLELRREPDETTRNFGAGWHSDWSFQQAPPAAIILHAKVVPPIGGDTLFADLAAAYDALSDTFQAMILPLRALHSARLPYGARGFFANEKGKRAIEIITGEAAEAIQSHPLVRRHPISHRRCLFISPTYTIGIEGMSEGEAGAILSYLYGHMTQDRFILRRTWSANMLTMWDNRRCVHQAEGGYDGHLRVMHRTTLAGEVPVG